MKKIFNSPFRVTQAFGVNPTYYQRISKGQLKAHEGIDLVPTNSDWRIYSFPYKGIVVKDIDMKERGGAYGIHATVWYPEIKKAFMYCHLSENYVYLNQELPPSFLIGKMGDTGNTDGAHLHLNMFEVSTAGIRLNGNNGYLGGLDPYSFLVEDVPVNQPPEDDMPKYLKDLFNEKNINPDTQEGAVRDLFDKGIKYDALKGDLDNCNAANKQQAELIDALRKDVDKLTKQLAESLKNIPNSPELSTNELLHLLVKKLGKFLPQ